MAAAKCGCMGMVCSHAVPVHGVVRCAGPAAAGRALLPVQGRAGACSRAGVQAWAQAWQSLLCLAHTESALGSCGCHGSGWQRGAGTEHGWRVALCIMPGLTTE